MIVESNTAHKLPVVRDTAILWTEEGREVAESRPRHFDWAAKKTDNFPNRQPRGAVGVGQHLAITKRYLYTDFGTRIATSTIHE